MKQIFLVAHARTCRALDNTVSIVSCIAIDAAQAAPAEVGSAKTNTKLNAVSFLFQKKKKKKPTPLPPKTKPKIKKNKKKNQEKKQKKTKNKTKQRKEREMSCE